MEIIAIPILVVLVGSFITIRYKETMKKRDKFDEEYSKFSKPLLHFIEGIKDSRVDLNSSFLTEFRGQKLLKDVFIRNLKRKRLNRFNQKWAEYEAEYNQVKGNGVHLIGAAIAPSQEALENAIRSRDRNAPRKWEADRKQNIHNIISELLEIAKIKIWF